jgi:hypothetical protein
LIYYDNVDVNNLIGERSFDVVVNGIPEDVLDLLDEGDLL